jgi:hypothetical protein
MGVRTRSRELMLVKDAKLHAGLRKNGVRATAFRQARCRTSSNMRRCYHGRPLAMFPGVGEGPSEVHRMVISCFALPVMLEGIRVVEFVRQREQTLGHGAVRAGA